MSCAPVLAPDPSSEVLPQLNAGGALDLSKIDARSGSARWSWEEHVDESRGIDPENTTAGTRIDVQVAARIKGDIGRTVHLR